MAEKDNRTLLIILSYAGPALCCLGLIVPVIPLFMEKEDEEIRWHSKYGTLLAWSWFSVTVVLQIVGFILGLILSFFGTIFYLLTGLVWIGMVALCVMTLLKALKGERWVPLPQIEEILPKLVFLDNISLGKDAPVPVPKATSASSGSAPSSSGGMASSAQSGPSAGPVPSLPSFGQSVSGTPGVGFPSSQPVSGTPASGFPDFKREDPVVDKSAAQVGINVDLSPRIQGGHGISTSGSVTAPMSAIPSAANKEAEIANLIRLLETSPSAQGYLDLGKLYESQNKIDDALQAFHKSLELDQNFLQAYRCLAPLYMARQDYERAQNAYQWIQYLDPSDQIASQKLAEIQSLKG